MTTTNTSLAIASNATADSDAPRWHVAVRRYRVTERTRRVVGKYIVPLCSGRQLGGVYGHTTKHVGDLGDWDNRCRRCETIAAKRDAAFRAKARAWFRVAS